MPRIFCAATKRDLIRGLRRGANHDEDAARWLLRRKAPAGRQPQRPGLGGRIRKWFWRGHRRRSARDDRLHRLVVRRYHRQLGQAPRPVRFWPDNFAVPIARTRRGFRTSWLTLCWAFCRQPRGPEFHQARGGDARSHMPIVRSIYKGAKQIFETVFSQSRRHVPQGGDDRVPGRRPMVLVFICTPPGAIIAGHLSNEEHISVFLPCTPNPTTGFYFFCRRAMSLNSQSARTMRSS